jgi:hypothetical protein
MSWGNKIVIVYVSFVLLMVFMVYKSVNTPFDLVTKDYYKDELRYQDKIDGLNNAAKLKAVAITQNDTHVLLQLPVEMKGLQLSGEVWFYCVTDAAKDKKFDLQVNDSALQLIPKAQLHTTNYIVKINWKAGSTLYAADKEINITP